jgi:NitT/TauT family transport system ATP-binding protein
VAILLRLAVGQTFWQKPSGISLSAQNAARNRSLHVRVKTPSPKASESGGKRREAAGSGGKRAMVHIEARDITLTYQTPNGAVPAVHGVSFGIETSEFLCIVGPSGCGKSTLLNIMAGFLTPTGGEIRIGGAPVQGYGMDRGVVFQDFAQLFPWRTALGNVAFGLEMKGLPKAERDAIALEQLRLVKLENFARSYPHHLSGGMQQRVAIARALAYNPAVLLMDEPFAALDALTRDEMQRLLAEVWRTTRKTVIYVTHNVAEAVFLADRVMVMTPHPGTIKTEVPIRLPRPRDPLSVEFLDYQKQLLHLLGQEQRT